jgi:hypothetical protein
MTLLSFMDIRLNIFVIDKVLLFIWNTLSSRRRDNFEAAR